MRITRLDQWQRREHLKRDSTQMYSFCKCLRWCHKLRQESCVSKAGVEKIGAEKHNINIQYQQPQGREGSSWRSIKATQSMLEIHGQTLPPGDCLWFARSPGSWATVTLCIPILPLQFCVFPKWNPSFFSLQFFFSSCPFNFQTCDLQELPKTFILLWNIP